MATRFPPVYVGPIAEKAKGPYQTSNIKTNKKWSKKQKCDQGNIHQDAEGLTVLAGTETVIPFVTKEKALGQSVLLVCS